MNDELFQWICGKKIGEGVYREVYVYNFDPKYVVKVAKDENGRAHNLLENEIWYQADKRLARWLAPCHRLSKSGKYLLMRRTKPVSKGQVPRKIPAFFDDAHSDNWGILNGRVVCIDYGLVHLSKNPMRMVKKKWYFSNE